jgi:SAM-dependent methyltransferase
MSILLYKENTVEKLTDWFTLWDELVQIHTRAFARKKEHQGKDSWKNKAKDFDKMVKRKWENKDSSREYIISVLKSNPGSTALDIGAGTGAWSLLMAEYAEQVTALEPSDAMAEILMEKMSAEKKENIRIVKGTWPDISLEPHDYVLSSHSIYGVVDFKSFVLKMVETMRKACFLLVRVPFNDAIMAKAAMRVWGQPYDSPNFQIAYNALLQMGIYPNVLMETPEGWTPLVNNSLDDALAEMKSRLDIVDNSDHDEYLTDLLTQELKEENGRFVWPVGNQSALVYWNKEK